MLAVVLALTAHASPMADDLELHVLRGEPLMVGSDPRILVRAPDGMALPATIEAKAVMTGPGGRLEASVHLAPEFGPRIGCDPVGPDDCRNMSTPVVGPFESAVIRLPHDYEQPLNGPFSVPGDYVLTVTLPDGSALSRSWAVPADPVGAAIAALPVDASWQRYATRRRDLTVNKTRVPSAESCWKQSDTVTFCINVTDPIGGTDAGDVHAITRDWRAVVLNGIVPADVLAALDEAFPPR
jgi:hypothetical protein